MPGLVESPNSAALRSPLSPFHGISLPKIIGILRGSGSGWLVLGGPWFRSCSCVSAQTGPAKKAGTASNRLAAARASVRRMVILLARGAAVLAGFVHALGDVGPVARQD